MTPSAARSWPLSRFYPRQRVACLTQVEAKAFYDYACRKEDTIWQAFQDLDLDGTGEVDEEELLKALR